MVQAPAPGRPWWAVLTLTSKFAPSGRVVQSASKPVAAPGQTVEGPFATRALAMAALHGPVAGGPPHISPPNLLGGIDAVGHFFANLTDRQTVVRVAEVTLGMLLLLIGAAALVKDTPMGKAIYSAAMKTSGTAALLPK